MISAPVIHLRVAAALGRAVAGALLLLLVAPSLARAGDWSRIRIGVEGAHPPFNVLNDVGQPQGFEVDIARAVCVRLKASCEFVIQDFTGLVPGLLAGRYDAIFSSLLITKERKQVIDFSNRYYNTRVMFVTNRAKPVASIDPEAMKGRRIGAKLGSVNAEYIKSVYGSTGATIKLYVTQDEAWLDLENGRIDALIGDKTALLYWMQTSPAARCCEVVGHDVDLPNYGGEGVGAGVRKTDPELKVLIDRAIAELRADGGYRDIARKYFTFDPY